MKMKQTSGVFEKIKQEMQIGLKTAFWFSVFSFLLPFVILSYLILSTFRSIWRSILTMKYPQMEFIKSTSLGGCLETARNPGIFHVLLHIEGRCDIEIIKEKLFKYVLDRKDKVGRLCFPRLRTSFVKRWSQYAWIKNSSKFNVNNHVIVAASTYRGRPVNEHNIQEYVSTFVSKYIPNEIPQWQLLIIPSSSVSTSESNVTESYYILVRVHHLLLSDESNLSLKDMLLLDSFTSQNIIFNKTTDDIIAEPMRNLIEMPVYMPKLYNSITVSICNRWNEFIYHYDPSECCATDDDDDGGGRCKKQQRPHPEYVSQLISVIFISIVTVVLDFYKGFYAIKNEPAIKLKFLSSIIRREVKKRDLSMNCIINIILNSLHPMNMVRTTWELIWWLSILWTIKFPYNFLKEIISCGRYFCGFEQTERGYLAEYMPLLYNTLVEAAGIILIIVRSPRYIYEEFFEENVCYQHALQNVSLCGRKVMCWSEKININDCKMACRRHKLSDTELYYSTASAALNAFLNEYKISVPKYLSTGIQYIGNDYLTEGKRGTTEDVYGVLCVKLPMLIPSSHQIKQIRRSFRGAREKQIALNLIYATQRRYHILTKIFPAILIQLLCNYLTKKFTIAITQIEESSHNPIAITLWGHKIIDALYFTPTQSNIGVSLTLQQFGEYIRLGVMTDAQISPLHSKITQIWTSYINDIIENS